MPDLKVRKQQKMRDLHFYISIVHARKFDQLCDEQGAARGRILEALIDYYLEHRDEA